MTIKLADAAKYFKGLQNQIEAWDWLQGNLTPTTLETFASKYRADSTNVSAAAAYDNSWDGVFTAAKAAGAKFPEVVAAQWALESNWGTATSGTNNFFGIKGSGSNVNTQEFINGKWVTIVDGFINFPDVSACVTYLVSKWYKDYKEYKGVNRATDRNQCAHLLVQENYATDPDYAEKLIKVMDSKLGVNAAKNPLSVQYMSQRDNYRDANRTCFSSSCAMLLKYLKPSSIQDDNNYLMVVFQYGDSTDSNAQLKALAKFGVTAQFVTNGNRQLIQKQINAGKPVPVGFLHHGTADAPSGGGHWICIIGYDNDGYWVNDPWGNCDLVNGTYLNTNGAKLHYSYQNFEPRWLVEGPNSGWCILA